LWGSLPTVQELAAERREGWAIRIKPDGSGAEETLVSSDAEVRQIQADIQSVYDHLPADGRLRILSPGANHFTFSDDGALLKSPVMRGVLRLLGKLNIDGDRQLTVTAYCVHSFF